MRPKIQGKVLPSLVLKHSSHRPLQLQAPPSRRKQLFFTNTSEVILNSSALPLVIEVEKEQDCKFVVDLSIRGIIVKREDDSVSLPWSEGHEEKWVRVDFGQTMHKVQLKRQQNENHYQQLYVYPTVSLWKKMEPDHLQLPSDIPLKDTLIILQRNSKATSKHFEQKMKAGIYNKLKIRNTQRANSQNLKPKMAPLKGKEMSISEWYQPYTAKGRSHKEIICETQVLRKNGNEFDDSNVNRDSCTSASVRSEWIQVKKSKGGIGSRFRNKLSGNSGSKELAFKQDLLSCRVTPDDKTFIKRPKPKFYEQIPFTVEQLELKRHKFESQFINKQQSRTVTPFKTTQTEQSQVLEDICKDQNSQAYLQDTFENGVPAASGQNNGSGGRAVQESGTLCESVFE